MIFRHDAMSHSRKIPAALAVSREWFQRLFSEEDLKRAERIVVWNRSGPPENPDEDLLAAELAGAEVVVTSWGTGAFSGEVLRNAPGLRLVVHAGGSIRPLVTPEFWRAGIRICSAASAISYGVAEYCLGLMLIAGKRAYWAGEYSRRGLWKESLASCFGGPVELYQQRVGVIGCGFVGRQLVKLLKNFCCEVSVFDPCLDPAEAGKLGVRLCADLDTLFATCKIVSLNAPLTGHNRGMIEGRHFALLQQGSVFINTSRGALIKQDEMVRELETGRFVACLDVTDPEPCPLDHSLRRLPNVWLTPHIAGGNADNLRRVGSLVVDEIERYASGKPLCLEVREEDLQRIG
jgi:phosphoglycerate dehydrogenase-like enzyme